MALITMGILLLKSKFGGKHKVFYFMSILNPFYIIS